MADLDPNEIFGPTIRPPGGWLKVAWVAGIPVHLTGGGVTLPISPKYTNYALTPPMGWKQKTGHSRGTKETSWNIAGELTVESLNILRFLDPSARGQLFTVRMQQGPTEEIIPYCVMENFSLTGGSNGIITYTISGKSVFPVSYQDSRIANIRHHPIPGWASGRGDSFIRSWTITHSVGLTANWANDQNPRPVYYRPGESEYQLQLNTLADFREYDGINVGLGDFLIVRGLVTERGVTLSGREIKAYRVTVTNVNLEMNAYSPGARITASRAPEAWPSGI